MTFDQFRRRQIQPTWPVPPPNKSATTPTPPTTRCSFTVGSGLGKTHLMHAIGNRILEREPGARVIYVYAERFVNDMISAIRNSRMEEFKQHYRSVDALLIDDIQFFAGQRPLDGRILPHLQCPAGRAKTHYPCQRQIPA